VKFAVIPFFYGRNASRAITLQVIAGSAILGETVKKRIRHTILYSKTVAVKVNRHLFEIQDGNQPIIHLAVFLHPKLHLL
jgi:RsiW-degrading membrane proteinase PrsW (M82 family)